MASFNKLSRWPVGYFRAMSSWLLRNRRGLGIRLETLTAEIERIGFISVLYRAKELEGGARQFTEERIGISVSPGSTLEKLLQAYIAQGGNPFDISPFWHPDETAIAGFDSEGKPLLAGSYPHGGTVYLKSAEPNEPQVNKTTDTEGNTTYESTGYEAYPGGDAVVDRFYPARLGQRGARTDLNIVTLMRSMRDWANQDIKERVQDLEWRIIKQMDLREQLVKERDMVLQQAFGGSLNGLPGFDETQFNPGLTVPSLIQEMYDLLYETEEDGAVVSFNASEKVPFLSFTFEDRPSERRNPLGC